MQNSVHSVYRRLIKFLEPVLDVDIELLDDNNDILAEDNGVDSLLESD